MQVVLVMFRSDGERRSFSVVRNMTVIGRREDCDLRIPVGDVSRKHCRLVRTDDGIRIEDLGSSNGTIVNGERRQESDLQAGDVVGIGPVQFIVQIDGVPDEDEMVAPSAAARDESSMMGDRVPTEALVPDETPPHAAPRHDIEDSGEFQIEDEYSAGEAATIDEDVMEPAEHAEMEPLEELPLEELPANELTEEEFALKELPVEAKTPLPPAAPLAELEEDASDLEEITDESPAAAAELHEEEFALEELPADEIADETKIAPAPVQGLGDDETELGLEEFPLDEIGEEPSAPTAAAPAPPSPPMLQHEVGLEDHLNDDLEPLSDEGSLIGLDLLEESTEPAAATPPPPPPVPPAAALPTMPIEGIEPVDLDDEPPHTEETEPVDLEASNESAWDFVIDETDGDHSHHDFKIDLDSPSHP